MLLAVAPAGVSLHGIELAAFEDAMRLVTAGEQLSADALFFPMHRVERMELELPGGSLPSLSERFEQRTGHPAKGAFAAMFDAAMRAASR